MNTLFDHNHNQFTGFDDETSLMKWGEMLGRMTRPGDTIGLSGALGAGKTVVARGILRGLGYSGDVPSPSFAIAHPYDPPETHIPVLHCDFYRIEQSGEIQELGLDEYFDIGAIIAEWPEKTDCFGGTNHLALKISVDKGKKRILDMHYGEGWKERMS